MKNHDDSAERQLECCSDERSSRRRRRRSSQTVKQKGDDEQDSNRSNQIYKSTKKTREREQQEELEKGTHVNFQVCSSSCSSASSCSLSADLISGDIDQSPDDEDRCDADREMMIRDEEEEEEEELGRLVLNVDFAPPSDELSSMLTRCQRRAHLMEVSLCIRRADLSGAQSEQTNEQLSVFTCDSSTDKTKSLQEPLNRKRRLIYERMDRFPLRVGGHKWLSGKRAADSTSNKRPILPFAPATFDASFCFNLLNVRVVSRAYLRRLTVNENEQEKLDASETQQEDEQRSWLELERLTCELRVALLSELSRAVKPKGKIMITVFAYECSQQEQQQDQQQAVAKEFDQEDTSTSSPLHARGAAQVRPATSSQRQLHPHSAQGKEPAVEADPQEDSCCPRCRLEWSQSRRGSTMSCSRYSRVRRKETKVKIPRSRLMTDGLGASGKQQVSEESGIEGEQVGEEAGSGSLLLRVLGGSLSQLEMSDNRRRVQVQDSLGEAARALGRRFSLGGSALFGRLFSNLAASSSETAVETSKTNKECDTKKEDEVRLVLPKSECSMQCASDPENEPAPEQIPPPRTVNEAMSLFQNDEFARRHRQSIAVQTFFTKSIEVNEDDDLLQPEKADPHAEGEEEILPVQATNDADDLKQHEEVNWQEDEQDPPLSRTDSSQAEDDDTTTSGWTAPTSTGLDLTTPTTTSNNNSAQLDQPYKRKVMNADSRRSGGQAGELENSRCWPQSAASSGCFHQATSNYNNGAAIALSSNDIVQLMDPLKEVQPTTLNKQQLEKSLRSPSNAFGKTAAKTAQEEANKQHVGLAVRNDLLRNVDDVGNNFVEPDRIKETAPERHLLAASSQLERLLSSEMSSFTLPSSTRDTPSSSELNPDGAKVVGRKATKLPNMLIELQHQRRAFSETEAYKNIHTGNSEEDELDPARKTGAKSGSFESAPKGKLPSAIVDNSSRILVNKQILSLQQTAAAGSREKHSLGVSAGSLNHQQAAEQMASKSGEREFCSAESGCPIGQPARSSWASGAMRAASIGRTSFSGLLNQEVGERIPNLKTRMHQQHHHHQQQQQQQWCHSATFSSSLNSDISTSGGGGGGTSGGGQTKDTSEKDSSRRTSTLSGISSIYQQEISLATTTTTGGAPSHATPANSTVGAPAGMGSIPELSDLGMGVTTGDDAQQASPWNAQVAASSHIALTGINSAPNSSSLDVAEQEEPVVAKEFARTSSDDNCEEPSSASNLQRVAASLRSQLRERLSRPLSAIMVGMSVGHAEGETGRQDPFHQPRIGKQHPHGSSELNPPTSEIESRRAQSASSGPLMFKHAHSVAGRGIAHSSVGHSPTARSIIPPSSSGNGSSSNLRQGASSILHQRTLDTPTPASLRSFFRSTSSAAFNAFASSFQQQSSSSTPTGTTVITQHLSGYGDSTIGAGFAGAGSCSLSGSEVFADSPAPHTSASPLFSAGSSAARFGLFTGSASGSPRVGVAEQANEKCILPPTSVRSPSSPLSVTSTRFFARIRDKFSLSSTQSFPTAPPPPPPPPASPVPTQAEANEGSSVPNRVPFLSLSSKLAGITTEEPSTGGSLESSSDLPEFSELNRDTTESPTANELEPDSSSGSATHNLPKQVKVRPVREMKRRLVTSAAPTGSLRRRTSQPNANYSNLHLDNSNYQDEFVERINSSSQSSQPRPEQLLNQFGCEEYDYRLSGANYVGRSQPQTFTGSTFLSSNAYPASGWGFPETIASRAQLWLDSSQLSVDSSSSARSLHSCWFSMPELHAMYSDSSSQVDLFEPVAELGESSATNQVQSQAANPLLSKSLQQVLAPPDWPSGQLYQQVVNQQHTGECAGKENWSLSDLNLTSDDIAPRDLNQQQLAANFPTSLPELDNKQQVGGDNLPATSGMVAQAQSSERQQLAKGATLDDSICASIEMRSSSPVNATNSEVNLSCSNQQERPISQNSTISSNSCALSDLNSSCGEQDLCPNRTSEVSATQMVHRLSPEPANSSVVKDGQERRSLDLPNNSQYVKQRAMSLATPSISSAHQRLSPLENEGITQKEGGKLELPAQQARRKSAMGCMLARNPDMAPAAASLELRLATRKNRVKLTDLHPITFMNDRQFLSSMNSLKGADQSKLNALYDSPVGRRLSMNAEMAALNSQQLRSSGMGGSGKGDAQRAGREKSGVKIGLTGYVYIEQPTGSFLNGLRGGAPRRPSLAPNFWRAQQAAAEQVALHNNSRPSSALDPIETDNHTPLDGKQRLRASSCIGQCTSDFQDQRQQPIQPREWLKTVGPDSGQTSRRARSPLLLKRVTESSIECEILPTTTSGSHDLSKLPIFDTSGGVTTCTESPDQVDEDNHQLELADSSSSGSSSSSSSSDDGDIDKLVAQYAKHSSIRTARGGGHKEGVCGGIPAANSSNDAVLRQLLLAAGSAIGPNAHHGPGKLIGGGATSGVQTSRRFSAINLYQRDEDMFVANSMRRPLAARQLGALSSLAGTLPVLPMRPNLLSQLGPHHTPIKSIISGSSGLGPVSGQQEAGWGRRSETQLISSHIDRRYPSSSGDSASSSSSISDKGQGSAQVRVRLTERAGSMGSALLVAAEVDVEEQLNRLRQQERRSLASLAVTSGSSSSSGRGESTLEIDCKGSTPLVSVTGGIWSAPKEAEEADELTTEDHDDEKSAPPTAVAEKSNFSARPKSPPLSPQQLASPIVSPVGMLQQTSGLYVPTKSSTEPFKQLDTIIEGRGLLLGPEQQADPNYANLLRRLSGNHSRHSSLVSSPSRQQCGLLGIGTGDEASSGLEKNSGNQLWCECDDSLRARRRPSASYTGVEKPRTADSFECVKGKELDEREETTKSTLLGSSTTRFVLNTMRSLARKTLDNLTQQQPSPAPTSVLPEQLLVSMNSVDEREQQKRARRISQINRKEVEAEPEPEGRSMSRSGSSSSTSVTGSADDSSDLISLDDAENYLVQNKANKMSRGQSLEYASSDEELAGPSSPSPSTPTSSPSSSSSSDSYCPARSKSGGHFKKGATGSGEKDESPEKRANESEEEISSSQQKTAGKELPLGGVDKFAAAQEEQEEEEQDEEEEEEEEEEPKICYKCNRRIQMELPEDFAIMKSMRSQVKVKGMLQQMQNNFQQDDNFQLIDGTNLDASRSSIHQQQAAQHGLSNSVGGARGSRKHTHRSASMNADIHVNGPPGNGMGNLTLTGASSGRRKNKWHIQRNLAPKLKRQRSFSANYAPEVPNPMMPPPRRFSAAPTLTCPHRNKSSSLSSSSLHHAYSIDSSESIITVIPSNRNFEFKSITGTDSHGAGSSARGSLSCSGTQIPRDGSLYALPRSPLSPRSPSRCSPAGLLTPNTSEPPTFITEPPFSPTNTTTSSAVPITIIQQHTFSHQQSLHQVKVQDAQFAQIHVQSPISNSADRSSCCIQPSSIPNNETEIQQQLPSGVPSTTTDLSLHNNINLSCQQEISGNKQLNGNLSACDNGTSCNSSRNDLNELFCLDNEVDAVDPNIAESINTYEILTPKPQDLTESPELVENTQNYSQETCSVFKQLNEQEEEEEDEKEQENPNIPIVREIINDLCYRHSKEELEFLIGQLGNLRISDSYFSERSSTICMIIEVKEP